MLQNADCCLLVWGGVLSRHYVPGRSQKKNHKRKSYTHGLHMLYTRPFYFSWKGVTNKTHWPCVSDNMHVLYTCLVWYNLWIIYEGGHKLNALALCEWWSISQYLYSLIIRTDILINPKTRFMMKDMFTLVFTTNPN